MRTRLKVLLAVIAVLVVAAVCGGWKWHDPAPTKSAGFTWDSQLSSWVEADGNNGNGGPSFYGFIWDNGGS